MFTVEERDRVRARIIELARADARIVSGAELGSLTRAPGERWGDVDLTFGVAQGHEVGDVLDDWTRRLRADDGAIPLFDLPHRGTLYRVFLFPGDLQVDLSLTPRATARMGPKFSMLFGDAIVDVASKEPDARELFGRAVHDAVRARLYVERARLHHAIYCIGELRNNTLSLASARRGLPAVFGRGFDDLPDDVRARAALSLVGSVDRDEIMRALLHAIDALIVESDGLEDGEELAARLRALKASQLE